MRLFIAASSIVAFFYSTPALTCTAPEAPDTRFVRFSAGHGELWWFRGSPPVETQTIILSAVDGELTVSAAVAGVGVQDSVAVIVPDDAPIGSQFSLPDFAEFADAVLSVGDRSDGPLVDLPTPSITIDEREVVVGYKAALALPGAFFPCTNAPGFWSREYGFRPFLSADIPEGLVLDVTLRPVGEEAFAPVTSANQVLFDAQMPGTVEVFLQGPPGGESEFVVHARFRRAMDGAIGDVASTTVQVDPSSEERLDCVGCSSSSAAPFFGIIGVVALRRGRKKTARVRHVPAGARAL